MSTQLNAATIWDILFCHTHQRLHPTEHNFSYCFGTDMLFPFCVYRKKNDDKIIIPFSNKKEPHRLGSTVASHKGKLGGRPFGNSEIQQWTNFLQSDTEVINMRAGNKTCLLCRYFGSLFSNVIRIVQIKLYCCLTTTQYSRCLKLECLTSWYELLFPVDKSVIKHRATTASTSRSPLNLWPPMAGREIASTF